MTENGTARFAWPELLDYMRKRAPSEAGVALPSKFLFNVISFDNGFELKDEVIEIQWFQDPSNGRLDYWTLVGQLLPPEEVGANIREVYMAAPGLLWGIDQIPQRMIDIRARLETPQVLPLVMFVHCEAGCDRTGEFSAAYYMQYQNMTVSEAFAKDTTDCGRPPNYFSKSAIGWYCLTLQQQGYNVGDCLNF